MNGDIQIGKVVLAAFSLVACAAAAGITGWVLMRAIPPETAPPPPTEIGSTREPSLQVSPETDIAAMRTEEERILRSGGWIDERAGIARIPIERAMTLVVKRSREGKPGP